MNPEELLQLAQKLSGKGMTTQLENGKEAIPVSLMIPTRFTEKSRTVRKRMLQEEFSQKLNDFDNTNLEIDFNSISVSGQTVQAKLGIDNMGNTLSALSEKNIRIDPNIEMDIL